MRGECLRHEADFDDWADVRADEGVEDAVSDGEVVDRSSVRLFGVDVGGAPLEGTVAVSGGEEIVRAIVNRDWTECGEFAEKLFAVWSIEVVWLVGAEVVPDGLVRRGELGGVNLYEDWRGL
jgi:hypothetical protein